MIMQYEEIEKRNEKRKQQEKEMKEILERLDGLDISSLPDDLQVKLTISMLNMERFFQEHLKAENQFLKASELAIKTIKEAIVYDAIQKAK